jgi:amidohydrolase
MTVLDSRPSGSSTVQTSTEMLVDPTGVSMSPVDDLGEGRGPAWLDDWLKAHASDVVAWRRHIHANPELSRREYNTTELVTKLLREVGLKPRVLPGGTGLICDVGSGPRCVALRADMDALPLPENTGLPFASTVDGASHACGHDAHTTVLIGTRVCRSAASVRASAPSRRPPTCWSCGCPRRAATPRART